MEINRIFLLQNKRWILGSVFLAIILLLPIFILFGELFSVQESSFFYLWDNLLIDYTFNTFYLLILTSFFSLLFGILPAWLITNYKFKGRNILDVILYLPLAIPTYIMAFTYSDMLSYTGPIQSFFRNNFFEFSAIFNRDYLQIEFLGLLMALSLYPYIYTSSRVSFSLLGSNYMDLSKNLGVSKFKSFFKILIPLSRPAIFSGLFLVLMEVLNEYGAVKYFGVNTYTTGIFRSWFSMGDIGTAIQLAFVLLSVVFIIFYLEKTYHSKTKFYYTPNSSVQKFPNLKGKNSFLVIAVCIIPFLFGFFFPFIFIIDNVFSTFESVDLENLIELTINSTSVSTISASLVVVIAIFFLMVEKYSKNKINFFISQTISLGYAIPGAVIGLGLIMLFTSVEDILINKFSIFSFSLIGSFFVLIYAYVIRFLAVGKSPIKSSLEKHPESYDETAKNLGLGPFSLFKKIHFPINKWALVIAFIVTFIDVLKELPITLILRPFNFDTLATQTFEFAVEEMIPLSSIYSLMIIIIGSILLIILKNIVNKQINVS
ncbi:MAG: ABC transporter permease [Flavobacteriaceae bacterium]